MADSRALEEEAERYNPVNPHSQLPSALSRANRGMSGGGHMIGGGATPSMGLSQFRGGRTRKSRHSPSEEDEAIGMGRHLSAHLRSLHGAGFHQRFLDGMNSGNAFIGGARTGRYEGQGVGEAHLGRESRDPMMGGQFRVKGVKRTTLGLTPEAVLMSMRDDQSPAAETGLTPEEEAHYGADDHLYGEEEPAQKQGRPKRQRRGGSSLSKLLMDDGLRAMRGGAKAPKAEGGAKKRHNPRAAIVKRVMAEKGMKMIEASKYVKEHGLY